MMLVKAAQQAVVLATRQQLQVQAKRTCYPYSYRLNIAPPRKRMPIYEKAMWGGVIFLTIWSVPVWVLIHINEYAAGKQAGAEE